MRCTCACVYVNERLVQERHSDGACETRSVCVCTYSCVHVNASKHRYMHTYIHTSKV
jgi:hypothetical protein